MSDYSYSKEALMNRRNFIKGAIVTTAVMTSSNVFADNYSPKNSRKLNRLMDKENPTELEQKHVPAVVSPDSVKAGEWFDVKVKVGYIKVHPSTPKHWITMIKLLINGEEVAISTIRTGGITRPDALFSIKLHRTAILQAQENCNLHGTWISEPVKIKVS